MCEVTPETTFSAARRLRAGAEAVAALNFASAKNPGGGFLGGAQAQEEDLCRHSALYASLTTPQAASYYAQNRQSGTALYTHHLIYSPAVPIFRDELGKLLETPVTVNVITAPAPNAGAVAQNSPAQLPQVRPTLRERAARVLGAAALTGQTHLVLGAWGCGVFRNDPAEVARIFRELLDGEARGVFGKVTFAIYDRSKDKATLGAFEAAF
ncbi:TIGR02452 family protein [Deinococcus lacus]|uniref:TIGR02452 family protein n=1 Tax=Deinococcus lacus TaxID=392561 RepID=A0ABW1YFY1_9DEIO